LKARGLNGRQLAKLTANLFAQIQPTDIPENIPEYILAPQELIGRSQAFRQIHFPASPEDYRKAIDRMKFEEFLLHKFD
jgi:ATP-dependent DNA helicase RecG